MDSHILSPDDMIIPPEHLLDPHNPANDRYFTLMQDVQRAMVAHQARMKPTHVEVCKLREMGLSNVKIAERVGLSQATVSKVVNSPDGDYLRNLLKRLAALIDGPNREQRLNLLWRIASDNEEIDARTAIAAVAEMNKMTGDTGAMQSAGTTNIQQNIVINQDIFPKGPLDQ